MPILAVYQASATQSATLLGTALPLRHALMADERAGEGQGMRRLMVLLGIVAWGLLPLPAHAAPACQYQRGFAALAAVLPQAVGRCRDDEHGDPRSGDVRQHTTTGLLAWRRADNTAAFTDGAHTWLLRDGCPWERLNTQRFAWEANPHHRPLAEAAESLPLQVARAAHALVVRLSSQTLTAYRQGTPVLQVFVTTGRPRLRTPTGRFTVFRRASPYLFQSPWAVGSPFWYPPSWVGWALEFRTGGYYLHDAPWEPPSVYGPGSQDGPDASHGCVQVPPDVMRRLFAEIPAGAPLLIVP